MQDGYRDCVPGFSLTELLVSLVIAAILAALSLQGLLIARHNIKVDKTRSTIRKIDDIITSRYLKFATKRLVPHPSDLGLGSTTRAVSLVNRRRVLSIAEMPDNYSQALIHTTPTGISQFSYNLGGHPILNGNAQYIEQCPELQTGPARYFGYAGGYGYFDAVGKRRSSFDDLNPSFNGRIKGFEHVALPGPELLYLNFLLYPDDLHPLQQFREDEFCDEDFDGDPEFADGWGRAIRFLRWAPGHNNITDPNNPSAPRSMRQFNDASKFPDRFDPRNLDSLGYMLWPLLISGGADGILGCQLPFADLTTSFGVAYAGDLRNTADCLGLLSDRKEGVNTGITNITAAPPDLQFGATTSPNDSRDDISNHLLKQ